MDDKGEKIVYLAREILEAQPLTPPVAKKKMSITMSLKTLCFTTVIAAASGNVLSTYVYEQNRPLNRYEKFELNALVYYAARIKNISEELLRQEIEDQLGLERIDDISAAEFPTVRRYLQEKAQ